VSTQHAFPQIDPQLNQITLVLGRKGSGKSVWAREAFKSWPAVDKLAIDPTGDADPGEVLAGGVRTVTVHKLPESLPMPKRAGEHVALRYVANPGAASYAEDLDRALGLALYPKNRRVLVWVDEAGEVFPANRAGPNARTLLQQSRHWYTSLLMCCPRPMNIDPLCISQADRVVIYDLPHPRDRERVAASIGIAPKVLDAELDETRARGAYWYLMYDAREHALYRCPPLPMSEGYKHAQQ
jgi:hypothetical protein